MPQAPSLPPEARRVLELARRDRAAAREALAKQPLEAQLELVCSSPAAERARLIELCPHPERLVPALPEAELCYTAKAVGLHDAGWLLEHARAEQVVACVDLDAWRRDVPDRVTLSAWLRALADANEAVFVEAVRTLDPELVVLYLGDRIEVALKPSEGDWEPPPGSRSVDGQFWFVARREKDDLSDVESLLRGLFQNAYWTYFRLMQGVIWETAAECEEWALRWRAGRLLDLGFPPWEEAMAIYGRLPADALARVEEDDETEKRDWTLPVWMPELPALASGEPSLFRALAALPEAERASRVRDFVALANKVAMASRLPLGDAESLPAAFERAAETASRGLDFVAERSGLDPARVVARLSLDRLFRVGANLTGELPRPPVEEDGEAGATD